MATYVSASHRTLAAGRLSVTAHRLYLAADAARARHCTVLYDRVTHCPTCRQLLVQEPGAASCRYGCGRIWRLVAVDPAVQVEFERRSGLAEAGSL